MAEALLRSIDPRLDVVSAGTNPAERVHPGAVAAMAEIGIDIAASRPRSVEAFIGQPFDFLVTVCDHAARACPVFTGAVRHRRHFGFDDPAAVRGTDEQIRQAFRRVRDGIQERFERFYVEDVAIGSKDG